MPSSRERGTESWAGEDGYKVLAVSGSGTAAMEMVIANRFRPNDRVLVPTNGKFGERVADICKQYCQVKHIVYEWGRSFDIMELEEQLGRGTFEALSFVTTKQVQESHKMLKHSLNFAKNMVWRSFLTASPLWEDFPCTCEMER